MAIKACTVNEKLYGIGSAPDLGLGNILWYRNDWAKNVGITEKPQTMDDVVDMAYKFAQEDPNKDGSATVGLGLTSDLWDGGIAIEGFFAGYGSYPIIWVEENGEMVYGGVQDSAKEVLGKLQKMYADGVIDQDFINVGAWEELSLIHI